MEKKVLRTIVGFLNSEGGILIWGAPTGSSQIGSSKEAFQGDLMVSDIRYEKDSFIAKIANRIVPSPRGVRFHRVEIEQRYLYLIEVPSSEYAPHQIDNIYYMRLDGQTVPAPHHYIEALFKKVTYAKLEAYLKIEGYQFENTRKHSRLKCAILFRNLSAFQNDFDLHCRIISSQGSIVDEGKSFLHIDRSIEEGSDIVREKIAETIYFGNYVIHLFDIVLNRDFLHQANYEFDLVLVFGARTSPMLQSRYKLQVGPKFPEKKQRAIVEKHENRYFHEIEEGKGLSDHDLIERLLND